MKRQDADVDRVAMRTEIERAIEHLTRALEHGIDAAVPRDALCAAILDLGSGPF